MNKDVVIEFEDARFKNRKRIIIVRDGIEIESFEDLVIVEEREELHPKNEQKIELP